MIHLSPVRIACTSSPDRLAAAAAFVLDGRMYLAGASVLPYLQAGNLDGRSSGLAAMARWRIPLLLLNAKNLIAGRNLLDMKSPLSGCLFTTSIKRPSEEGHFTV